MEFFRTVAAATDAEQLQRKLTIEELPRWCRAIDEVLSCQGEEGEIYCLWGQFPVRREMIEGGVRFTLPSCPNALQWTATTGGAPEPDIVQLHLSINCTAHEPDFIESIEHFLDAWRDGLANGLEGTPLPSDRTLRPQIGVGAVVRRRGAVLLVLRGQEPYAGEWAIPGGRVHAGETLAVAAERELLEETGITARVGEPVFQFEHIERDAEGRVRAHYVVIDLAAEYVAGEPRAGDDAREARWVRPEELAVLPVNRVTRQALQELGLAGQTGAE